MEQSAFSRYSNALSELMSLPGFKCVYVFKKIVTVFSTVSQVKK